jgi:hypothetical protein
MGQPGNAIGSIVKKLVLAEVMVTLLSKYVRCKVSKFSNEALAIHGRQKEKTKMIEKEKIQIS